MLTGNLVLARASKNRVIPRYLDATSDDWLEVAEGLLMVFREGVGMTRGEVQAEVDALIGEGVATLANRGLAKVLEDRAEFEVVADVAPEVLRERVFAAAAAERRRAAGAKAKGEAGPRAPFPREAILAEVAAGLGIEPGTIAASMFADLKDENRMISFDDIEAGRLLERYNVALAQAVLLKSTLVTARVRGEKPARYRQLFRWMKFHRLLHRIEGSMAGGYTIRIDGPLSLFSATNRYGLQMALFLPALLLCSDFHLDAEVRWGKKGEPRTFHLESSDGLVSHYRDAGSYVPAEIGAFLDRFRQVAPAWEVSESTDVVELGGEGVWVPDYRFVHRETGVDVLVEVLGFWKRASLDRLLRLLPAHGPGRFVLAISDRMKVDEEALGEVPGGVIRYKEIPNSSEMLAVLEGFLPR